MNSTGYFFDRVLFYIKIQNLRFVKKRMLFLQSGATFENYISDIVYVQTLVIESCDLSVNMKFMLILLVSMLYQHNIMSYTLTFK